MTTSVLQDPQWVQRAHASLSGIIGKAEKFFPKERISQQMVTLYNRIALEHEIPLDFSRGLCLSCFAVTSALVEKEIFSEGGTTTEQGHFMFVTLWQQSMSYGDAAGVPHQKMKRALIEALVQTFGISTDLMTESLTAELKRHAKNST